MGTPELCRDGQSWMVKVVDHDGLAREYRYAHESQARFFAAVFRMNPRVLPSIGVVSPPIVLEEKKRRRPRVPRPPRRRARARSVPKTPPPEQATDWLTPP